MSNASAFCTIVRTRAMHFKQLMLAIVLSMMSSDLSVSAMHAKQGTAPITGTPRCCKNSFIRHTCVLRRLSRVQLALSNYSCSLLISKPGRRCGTKFCRQDKTAT